MTAFGGAAVGLAPLAAAVACLRLDRRALTTTGARRDGLWGLLGLRRRASTAVTCATLRPTTPPTALTSAIGTGGIVDVRRVRRRRSSPQSRLRSRPIAPRSVRRPPVRTCVRALGQPEGRRARPPRCPATASRRRSGPSTPRGAGRPLLRGPGQVDPEPGAEGVADAVPVDDQPVSRMHTCLRLLRSGDTPILMADGPHQAAGRAAGRATTIYGTVRRGKYRRYCVDRGARPLVDDQARLPGDAGGWHRADRERRPPLPHAARLEARHRDRAGRRRSGRT